MSTASVKSLHLKQFSFVETNSPAKTNISPKTSSHRKFQATKTVFLPNPEQGAPKSFNFLMNTASPKIPQIKSPKLAKMASDYTAVQGRAIKNENILNDMSAQISPTISPSFHGASSHRALKGQLHISKPGVTSYGELQRNLKEFSQKSAAAEPVELLMLLNKKSEEISGLKKNIKELSEKAYCVSTKNKNPTEKLSNSQDLHKALQKKDQMIHAYEKLLDLLMSTGEDDQKLSKKGEEAKGRQKQRLAMVTENLYFDGRNSQHIRVDSSSGNNTTAQRSTNPTLSKISIHSPSLERNDSLSRYNSKITENETSTTSKGDSSAFSPPQTTAMKANAKNHSNNDYKMRALESIYKSATRPSKQKLAQSDSKNFLHRSLGPVMNEIVIFDKNLEKVESYRGKNSSSHDIETEFGFDTQEYPTKTLIKTESVTPLEQNLFTVFNRFENIMKKYEDGRNQMILKNEEILLKLNQLLENKHQQGH